MAESLMARLGLDTTSFSRGLTTAQTNVNKFAGDLKSRLAGAFALGALTAFANKVIDTGGKIKDMAERLGVSAEFAQKIAYNFEDIGGNAEDATKALEKLDDARRAALQDPSSKEGSAFRSLGFGDDDLLKTREGLYQRLSELLSQQNRSAQSLEATSAIFGEKLAGKVVPAAESMATAFEKAAKANLIMDEQAVSQLDAISKAKDRAEKRAILAGAGPLTNLGISGAAASETFGNILSGKVGSPIGALYDVFANVQKQQLDAFDIELEQKKAKLQQESAQRKSLQKLKDDAELDRMIEEESGPSAKAQPLAVRAVSAAQGIAVDSLTKVGNFLGESGRNIMAQLATQQIDILKKIEANTRPASGDSGSSLDAATP